MVPQERWGQVVVRPAEAPGVPAAEAAAVVVAAAAAPRACARPVAQHGSAPVAAAQRPEAPDDRAARSDWCQPSALSRCRSRTPADPPAEELDPPPPDPLPPPNPDEAPAAC